MTSFADRDGFIWYDGELKPWRECTVHVLTYSLHYGVGCFEGVRAYKTPKGTAVFRLEEHTKRLFNSAKILGITMPWDEATLNEAQKQVLRANQLEEAYIRPLVFYGSEGMGLRATGLKTHVVIAAWPWGAYLGDENLTRGIRIKTSSFARHYVNSSMCRAKASANYLNSSLALSEALKDGYDEALVLDPDGFVAEGSAENIFVISNGVISTPDVTSALDGITRRTVMQLAQDFGYTVRERRITRDEVYVADEAFFTGTAAEVTPIREVDNRQIGNGSRGPITEKLQKAYLDLVKGRSDQYPQWLSHI
ncbi:branched-chain amino acid transaminase [Sinimarinibacterium sp. NLF-5-8]|uniref:branched-chain amino acid transaminase n=1 Tax=Sinimarinibacterium sp. NLF-5-8 TaxID=2698684 RepID=UPI00137C22C7|nr:branched-chain amino acid transaminase [Sinimarinibacterium sp. NLF-5-8]QHS08768.1 branched-chain amino acid transaminase [Sinimarinibacterium sp. NLF-5-8]